jgi:glycosyltransferase involved in cell wall biosynthesis
MTATNRVLHLVDSLGLGGTQAILRDYFGAHLGDPTVHLYGLRTVPRQMHIDHPNVAVNRSPLRFSLLPLLPLRRLVLREGIGVLHCHLFRAQVFGYLLKRLFFPKITLVFHEHGRVVGREGESGFRGRDVPLFLRVSWRHVDRFICISEHTSSRLLKLIPGAAPTTIVVSNPIPVYPQEGQEFDRVALRREHGIPEDAFVVGFAARLIERKGWADFLEAVARVTRHARSTSSSPATARTARRRNRGLRELGLADRGGCWATSSGWRPSTSASTAS